MMPIKNKINAVRFIRNTLIKTLVLSKISKCLNIFRIFKYIKNIYYVYLILKLLRQSK